MRIGNRNLLVKCRVLGQPQGIASTKSNNKGLPLQRATTRDCLYKGQQQGIASTKGNNKRLPLTRATIRDCP
ncbi:hypothetical protein BGS_0414 [Beggiatoa sp. SS]|nr:hypothetical protein BGS_0414 [Beggiatoa sp. SS]